jgi:hypothetical protein
LTLAASYAEGLTANVTIDGQRRPAPVLPAYGALTAVIVPRGAGRLRVETR